MNSSNHLYWQIGLFCSFLSISTVCAASSNKVEVIQGKGSLMKGSASSGSGRQQANSDRLDQDGNKKLSMDELLAEHQRQIKAFAQADKNKDGELSATERKAFKKSIKLKSCVKQ